MDPSTDHVAHVAHVARPVHADADLVITRKDTQADEKR